MRTRPADDSGYATTSGRLGVLPSPLWGGAGGGGRGYCAEEFRERLSASIAHRCTHKRNTNRAATRLVLPACQRVLTTTPLTPAQPAAGLPASGKLEN